MMPPRYTAQFGEDVILDREFETADGVCVEVGANDGVAGSNTYFFEQRGWRSILVEADPEMAAQCRVNRPRSEVVECAVVGPGAPSSVRFTVVHHARGMSGINPSRRMLDDVGIPSGADALSEIEVPARTLDDVLAERGVTHIDFITIDVEGHEWDVLEGFTIDRYRPAVVIIERNTHFPDRRIMRYLREHGYAYRRTTGVNDWFYATSPAVTQGRIYGARLALRFYVTPWHVLAPERRRLEASARTLARNALSRVGALELARDVRDRFKRRR